MTNIEKLYELAYVCGRCYDGSGWIFKLSDEVLKGNFEVLDE